ARRNHLVRAAMVRRNLGLRVPSVDVRQAPLLVDEKHPLGFRSFTFVTPAPPRSASPHSASPDRQPSGHADSQKTAAIEASSHHSAKWLRRDGRACQWHARQVSSFSLSIMLAASTIL